MGVGAGLSVTIPAGPDHVDTLPLALVRGPVPEKKLRSTKTCPSPTTNTATVSPTDHIITCVLRLSANARPDASRCRKKTWALDALARWPWMLAQVESIWNRQRQNLYMSAQSVSEPGWSGTAVGW